MHNSLAIANYFIELTKNYDNLVSPMKLQKLVYFAHGWCLAHADKPLINEKVEAWQYRPVVSSLYLTAITYYTGATLLVSFGYGKTFNMSVIYSTVLFLLISLLLCMTDSISVWSVLYTMIFVEIYIVIYRFYYCKRYEIL